MLLTVLTKQNLSVYVWAVVCIIWPEPSEASDILGLKHFCAEQLIVWIEIEILFGIAIFVGHKIVEYLQLYLVQPNIITLLRLECSAWSFMGCQQVTQAFRSKLDQCFSNYNVRSDHPGGVFFKSRVWFIDLGWGLRLSISDQLSSDGSWSVDYTLCSKASAHVHHWWFYGLHWDPLFAAPFSELKCCYPSM